MSRKNVPTGSPFGDEFGYSRAVRVGASDGIPHERARVRVGVLAGDAGLPRPGERPL